MVCWYLWINNEGKRCPGRAALLLYQLYFLFGRIALLLKRSLCSKEGIAFFCGCPRVGIPLAREHSLKARFFHIKNKKKFISA